MSDKIRVLIVDDQELVRRGYKAILSTYDDLEMVGMATDGKEAVELAQTLEPDVVLMDVRMPEMDGIEATRSITSNPKLANTHVLVLTTFDVDEYVYDALSAGASGFLLKDADPDEIAQGVRVVARGDALIEPSVMKRLIKEFASCANASAQNAQMTDVLRQLTDRELEILRFVAKGYSNGDIAEEFVISPATVKTHVARIMSKLDAHDRAGLVIFAYESGLV